jgi:hypothetical protein
MQRKPRNAFIIISGLLIVGLAVFAQWLGIDNNAEWGRGRIILLIIGFCLSLIGTLFSLQRVPLPDWIRRNHDIAFVGKLWQKYLFVLPVSIFVLVVYVWFASVGLWTTWPARTEYGYYALLARAFEKQELHLPVRPTEKLLALPDPYDPNQRQGTGEPLDFSLYKEKFFLYWGPVPAVILVAIQSLIPKDLPDVHLVFGFSCGLFLVHSILMIAIWDRYFDNLPKWTLIMAVLLVGLSAPYTWMLSTGRIYEAAIVGGQFFLVAGFLAAFSALDRPFFSDGRLILAGSFWALAIGTRLTLLLPIGFVMLTVAYRIWKKGLLFSIFVQKMLCLGWPLFLTGVLLAGYNLARFDSLSETGFSYMLVGHTNLRNQLGEVVSYRYIIQNLFNYFLVPFQLKSEFPFIFSNLGKIEPLFSSYSLPGLYSTNPITGLIYVVPFSFFSLIPVYALFSKRTRLFLQHTDEDKSVLRWIILTLAGSSLLALLLLLTFFWAAMRYIADFLPMLLTLSIIGFCQGYIALKERKQEKYIAIAGISLAGISLVMSTILGLSGDIPVFEEANPALLEWFSRFFE